MSAVLLRRAPAALAAAFFMGGCSEHKAVESAARAQQSEPRQLKEAPADRAASARYVAVRNFIVLETDPAQVEAALQATSARCVAPDCEILESAVERASRDAPPRARLKLRIVPKGAAGLIDDLARRGDVIERRVEAEDMTDQVIDVDARLKNTTELRDRLRALLGTRGAAVKDLVELESQLSRVQSELDSAQGRRKALANETEKVMVAIDIRSRREIAESGVMAPVVDAVKSVGRTFAHSLAALIAFVVAAVPWLVLLVPAGYLWRRWRRGRGART